MAGLRPHEAMHRLSLRLFPVGEALQPGAFLLDPLLIRAQLVRVIEAREEGERILDLVDAEVETFETAEGEVEVRRVPGREHLARRKGERRPLVWCGVLSGHRRRER